MPLPTNKTARSLLVGWANNQDHWVRSIVTEVLRARDVVAEPGIDQAVQMYLSEKSLNDAPPQRVALLDTVETHDLATQDLRLVSIGNFIGVNALASAQTLSFNERMTICFGENGAGKTGYTRVLKCLAGVRNAEPVLGNVKIAGSKPKPSATIRVKENGVETEIFWTDEVGVPPLNRMSVFDTRAVSIHVDDSLAYVYTPSELALFRFVNQAIEAVRIKLEAARLQRQPPSNPFLPHFELDTFVYPIIKALGAASDIEKLRELATLSPEDENRIIQLREQIDSLKTSSAPFRVQSVNADRDIYRGALDLASSVLAFDSARYRAKRLELEEAQRSLNAAADTSFSGGEITGVLNDSWRKFIEAAEAFLVESGQHEYPSRDDACIYCHQKLSESAKALVTKYREYCNGGHRLKVTGLETELSEMASGITKLDTTTLQALLVQKKSSYGSEDIPSWIGQFENFFLECESLREVATSLGTIDDTAIRALAEVVRITSTAATALLDGQGSPMVSATSNGATALSTAVENLRQLTNRAVLRDRWEDVFGYVSSAKWSARLGQLLTRVPIILRTLTDASKIASETLLNEKFAEAFNTECRRLNAPKVELDFIGIKGRASRRKAVCAEHRPSETLSEGEQKVIAIADFLAEAGIRPSTVPIVFDDPVNSFDYRRIEHLVDRLFDLSTTHQVIVFSHNIWFASALLSKFEKVKDGCIFYTISADDGQIGLIGPSVGPRVDTPKSLGARIAKAIEAASKLPVGDERTDEIRRVYGMIRGWCEAFVEQDLLKDVTRRYRANMMMTKLGEIRLDRMDSARQIVFGMFERACRIIDAHSQPLEALSVPPSLDDLRRDWKVLDEARGAYIAQP